MPKHYHIHVHDQAAPKVPGQTTPKPPKPQAPATSRKPSATMKAGTAAVSGAGKGFRGAARVVSGITSGIERAGRFQEQYDAKDYGTSEGAKKAAQTRGKGGGGGLSTHEVYHSSGTGAAGLPSRSVVYRGQHASAEEARKAARAKLKRTGHGAGYRYAMHTETTPSGRTIIHK